MTMQILLSIKLLSLFLFSEHYIGKYVEPMVWHYNPRDNFMLPNGKSFYSLFSNIFKTLVDMQKYL